MILHPFTRRLPHNARSPRLRRAVPEATHSAAHGPHSDAQHPTQPSRRGKGVKIAATGPTSLSAGRYLYPPEREGGRARTREEVHHV